MRPKHPLILRHLAFYPKLSHIYYNKATCEENWGVEYVKPTIIPNMICVSFSRKKLCQIDEMHRWTVEIWLLRPFTDDISNWRGMYWRHKEYTSWSDWKLFVKWMAQHRDDQIHPSHVFLAFTHAVNITQWGNQFIHVPSCFSLLWETTLINE